MEQLVPLWVRALVVAAGLTIVSAGTWYVTNDHWTIKWQNRDLDDANTKAKYAQEKSDIEHDWASKFASIQSWYQQELEDNRNEAENTIAAYRNGNLRLRAQFTCLNKSVSDAASPGQVADAGRKCGLQSGDVEFLIRYAERAQAIVIKYNKAVKALNAIYSQPTKK